MKYRLEQGSNLLEPVSTLRTVSGYFSPMAVTKTAIYNMLGNFKNTSLPKIGTAIPETVLPADSKVMPPGLF